MMPAASGTPYKHIFIRDDGRAMIGKTRMKVEHIVLCDHPDMDAKRIKAEIYPFLTLGQIHSALAYYYDNKELVDRQIQEGLEYMEKMRALYSSDQPTRAELMERLRAKKAREKAEAVEPA